MKKIVLTLLLAGGVAAALAADPPDTVTIDALNHWFAPVEFTHGDHLDVTDDCSACHHDQEPDEIEACGECHSADYDPSEPDVPDLKMAYHMLCVACHQQEEASLACVDCHARQALPEGPELKEAAVR